MKQGIRAAFAALLPALLVAGNASAALPIQNWAQPSGARVWLIESHVLPMVDVQMDFDAGERRSPPDKAGLADVTAGMASKGLAARDGEPAMDENQLGEAWADLGAAFAGSASADRMSFTMRSLTDPKLLPQAVRLGARQLGEPSYPDDVWTRERARMSSAIREADTRPPTVARKAFSRAVYGGHPYGSETTEESLARITTADMHQVHDRYLQACRAKVSIVGDLTREQADRIATQLLSRLPARGAGGCDPLPAVAEVPALAAPLERDIAFAAAQAQVLIGQPGYKRSDPDHFPLLVGNYILGGGGFVSRLTTEVREKRGLSYSVYSYFSPGMHAGAFILGLQTRPDQAPQAVQVARDVLARFVAEGPTAAELKAAKDFLIGGFPLLLDSNAKLLGNLANIAWYDLPLDYLDTWTKHVEAVTAEQVKAAMQRKLQPARMVTVIVGAAPPR
ncbi:MAG TPA: pitrilysin family protein [Ramlibacter sp.]|nr:pitrilysin family protein [Ramlibacter sp.]HVZ44558.1 pitrilysin family protein [Ramlibacter sp.]